MSYKLLQDGGVQRVEDEAFIPPTPDNMDWVAYQKWLAQGNTPQPADPVPEIVPALTVDDLAAALVKKGALAQADLDGVAVAKLSSVQAKP